MASDGDGSLGDVPSEPDHATHIDAVGHDLRVPALAGRMVPSAALDVARDELEALAARHGAVLARTSHFDEWYPLLVLRVDAPWLVLEQHGEQLGIEASVSEHGTFVAVVADEIQLGPIDRWDRAPLVDPPELVVLHEGVWESAHWRLAGHPRMPRHVVRDWTWANGGSGYPGTTLDIAFDVPTEDVIAFVASCAPLPYDRHGERSYQNRDGDRLRQTLDVVERGLALWRDYTDPSPAVAGFDAGLLLALADGALGELRWDLIEVDYGTHQASGEDCASLAAYLAVDSDPDAQQAHWQALHAERVIDARAARTFDEVRDVLAGALGAPAAITDDAAFAAWYGAQPIDALPRRFVVDISLEAPRDAYDWLAPLLRGQRRIRWGVRQGRT
ncbi:MAG TPA: hypothetical protein VFQ53_05010 [Kofleriaceae bacterium]|nr:hypothetical protein [Kofleriaceae bacterium]